MGGLSRDGIAKARQLTLRHDVRKVSMGVGMSPDNPRTYAINPVGRREAAVFPVLFFLALGIGSAIAYGGGFAVAMLIASVVGCAVIIARIWTHRVTLHPDAIEFRDIMGGQ